MTTSKKYTSLETRSRIISLRDNEKLTEQEIADRLGIAPSTAHYWIVRRASASAADGLRSKPKSGRPRKLDADQDEAVVETSRGDPFLPATQILRELGFECCAETVRNRLRAADLRCRAPLKKDFLKQRHRDGRFAYAVDHASWTVEEHWNRVLFSDEKLFTLGGHGPQHVWRPRVPPRKKKKRILDAAVGDDDPQQQQEEEEEEEEDLAPREDRLDPRYIADTRNTEWGRRTIMVWACVSGGGRRNRIHLIEPERRGRRKKKKRTLDADYYVSEILKKIVRDDILKEEEKEKDENDDEDDDDNGMIFMHDRSPIHTAHKTLDWIERNNLDLMHDWPAKAPDMNPIENVWAEIERKLERRQCRDGHQLWMEVSQVFVDLTLDNEDESGPSDYVKKLVQSMPRRMAEVVRREGGWTQY